MWMRGVGRAAGADPFASGGVECGGVESSCRVTVEQAVNEGLAARRGWLAAVLDAYAHACVTSGW